MQKSHTNPQRIAENLLHEILSQANVGNKARAAELLPTLYTIIQEFPHILWHSSEVWKVAKALLIMYHYDVLDDEDENIELVEYAFVFAQRAVSLYEKQPLQFSRDDYFNALHTQTVLLSSCADCYVHSIAQLYLSQQKEVSSEHKQVSLQVSYALLPYMQYVLLEKISEEFEGLCEDGFLLELAHSIESEITTVSEKQITQASNLISFLVRMFQEKILKKANL